MTVEIVGETMNNLSWYYIISTKEVVNYHPRALDSLGPYPSKEAAQQALEIAKQRSQEADEFDEN